MGACKLIFIETTRGGCVYARTCPFDEVSVNPCHDISDYAHMPLCTSLHLKFCVCMCLSTPTSLCLSTYGFLYVPAATALSKGHKPLPEMGHFLFSGQTFSFKFTRSLQVYCRRSACVLNLFSYTHAY